MVVERILNFLILQNVVSLSSGASLRSNGVFQDFREVFNPPTMLLMSSTMERKVSYIQLSNFKAVGGVVLPLLDSGFSAPYGIAYDEKRRALYVADGALRKILRVTIKAFKCLRQCKGIPYQLRVDGDMITVVEGVQSFWVSVDHEGNLFFSDQETKSVSKLSVDAIQKIIDGELLAKDLKRTTEPEAEGEEAALESSEPLDDVPSSITVTTTPKPPSIYELYESSKSETVGTPAGVAAVAGQVYWTNQVGGFNNGAVSFGKTNPMLKQPTGTDDAPVFASHKLVNNTGAAYGISVSIGKVFFSDSSHVVWAANKGTGEVVSLTSSLMKPRGIVWDGDNTIYVADEEGNFVVSIPSGLLKANAPVSQTVDFHSPYGLAMINKDDPMWLPFIRASQSSASQRFLHKCLFVLASFSLAWL